MDQDVRDAEDGVGRVLADDDGHDGAVLLGDDAVDGQGRGDPQRGLEATVVVGVEKRQLALLIDGVLLDVQARGVDVRAENVEALGDRGASDVEQGQRLAAGVDVELVAGLDGIACGDGLGQVAVAGRTGELDRGGHALSLGLVVRDERAVALGQALELGELLVIVLLPCAGTLHGRSSLVIVRQAG